MKFKNNYFGLSSFIIEIADKSYSKVYQVSIDSFDGNFFRLSQNSVLIMNGTSIKSISNLDGRSIQGTGINCEYCKYISIAETVFENLTSYKAGGCLYISQDKSANGTIINFTDFKSCESNRGGAIFVDNSIYIYKSNFIMNKATGFQGQGAGIFMNTYNENAQLFLLESTFINNSAQLSGGGIQWYYLKPNMTDNIIESNSALYGPNLASFQNYLAVSKPEKFDQIEYTPGQKNSVPLKIIIKDHYNQIYTNDNSTKLNLYAILNENDTEILFLGYTQQIVINGSTEFQDLKILGKPGTKFLLNISADSFDFFYRRLAIQTLQLHIYLRNCVSGESELGNKCEVCESGFYNLKAGQACLECVEGGICPGGDLIYAKPGYWRRNNTDHIFKCFNEDACLGDQNTSACNVGYEGNLCQVCSPGYSTEKENFCSKCLNKSENVGKIIGLLVIISLFLIFQCYSTLKSVYESESITSIYLKILVSYSQLISIIIQFQLDWPELVLGLFNIQNKVSFSIDQFISVDCIISDLYNPFYAKVLAFAIIPFLFFIISLIFWLCRYKIWKSLNVKEKLIGTIIVQFFFFYPTLLKLNFQALYCTELDYNDQYLTVYMNLKCWEGFHLFFGLTVVIPSLIIFCVAIPLLLYINIRKNRMKLEAQEQKLKYGFFYNGFKDGFYYWEFIIIIRELFITLFFVFISNISIPMQALLTFLVILASLMLQLKLEPYSTKQLNFLELLSILVSATTIYSGIMYLTKDINEWGKFVIFVIMALSNIAFITVWIYFSFSVYIMDFVEKFKICRRIFRIRKKISVAKVETENNPNYKEMSSVKDLKDPNYNSNKE